MYPSQLDVAGVNLPSDSINKMISGCYGTLIVIHSLESAEELLRPCRTGKLRARDAKTYKWDYTLCIRCVYVCVCVCVCVCVYFGLGVLYA